MLLRLTDDTTTAALNDEDEAFADYGVYGQGERQEWTPAVAGRRIDQMAGRGPFEEVNESIPFHARGSTGAAALVNARIVATLLDQADRWAMRHNVAAVKLQFQPTNTGLLGILEAALWEREERQQSALALSPAVNWATNTEIEDLAIQLRRRGLWLLSNYTVDNHIPNSSFESGASTPTGWSTNGSPTVAQSGSNVVHGSYCTSIQGTGSPEVGIYIDISGLTASSVYTLSVYVTPTTGTGRLRAYDGGGFTNAVTADSSGTSLQRLSLNKTCPGGGSIRVALWVPTGGGVAYFDAIQLELGSTATDYHPKQSEVMTASASAADNPSILEASFAVSGIPSDLPCPIKVELGDYKSTTLTVTESFLALVSNDDEGNFRKASMSTMTATDFTDQTDTTNKADGGSVLRYTPSDTDEHESGAVPIAGVEFSWHRLAFLATIRNNNTSKTYRVKVRGRPYAGSTYYVDSKETIIDVSDTDPHPYSLGMIDGFESYEEITLVIAASATGSTLDIDSLIIVPLYDEGVHIIKIDAFETDSGAYAQDIVIDSAALTDPQPKGYAALSTGDELTLGMAGDDYVTMRGLSVKALWLACRDNYWVYVTDGGSPLVFQNDLNITRQLAYLTPE